MFSENPKGVKGVPRESVGVFSVPRAEDLKGVYSVPRGPIWGV